MKYCFKSKVSLLPFDGAREAVHGILHSVLDDMQHVRQILLRLHRALLQLEIILRVSGSAGDQEQREEAGYRDHGVTVGVEMSPTVGLWNY